MKRIFTKDILRRALGLMAGTALLLAACDNSFLSPLSIPDETGTGQVRVSVQTDGLQSPGISASVQGSDPWSGNGPARTVYPTKPDFYYTYTFTKAGESTGVQKIPDGNGVFTLETGVWNLKVDAYLPTDHTKLAATGSTGTTGSSAAFTVSQDTTTSNISITLVPYKSGETGGSLTWAITYPEGTTLESLTWKKADNTGATGDLKTTAATTKTGPATANHVTTFSGTKTPAAAGYYQITALLAGAEGKTAGRSEVVHIYQNLTTDVVFAFGQSDFTKDLPAGSSVGGTITLASNENPAAGALTAASVQLKDGSSPVGTPVHPDSGGIYRFDGVADGTYTIEVSLAGYVTGTISGFTVSSGNVTGKDLTLAAAPVITSVSIAAEFRAGTAGKAGTADNGGEKYSAGTTGSPYGEDSLIDEFAYERQANPYAVIELSATVSGYNNPPQEVLWSLTKGKTAGYGAISPLAAVITQNGVLTVVPDSLFPTSSKLEYFFIVWATPTGVGEPPKGMLIIRPGNPYDP
jgi:hypothetical protein